MKLENMNRDFPNMPESMIPDSLRDILQTKDYELMFICSDYKSATDQVNAQIADINKIVTIEASGIAPAIMVGYIMHLPVVFIKKKQPKTMENMLSTVVHSFTKDRDYTVCISNNFLTADDRILFIDDFLAYGNAAMGVLDLVKQSGAKLEGMGFIIEKAFQKGRDVLNEADVRVESLAIIDSLENCTITIR